MGFSTPFQNSLEADFRVWAVDAFPAVEVAEAEGDREETGDTWTPVSYTRHALLGPGARDAAPGARAADGESASVAELLPFYEGHAQQACGCPGCSLSASRSPTAPDGSAWSDYATNGAQVDAAAQVGAATQFGNDYVDGILYGTRWTGPLTYSFADSAADFGSPYPYTIGGLQPVTPMQQAATRAILEGVSVGNTFAYGSYADVANIAITLASNPTGPSDLVIAEADTLDGNNIPTARVVDFPELDQRISGGDVLYGNDSGVYRTPLPGNFAWVTHIHEYGHALGLSHGHNGGGSIFNKTLPTDRNAEEFSVMSYASIPNDFVESSNNEQFGHPQTLMQLDLLALQHLYGANYSTNSGNTTYRWSPTTGQMSINGVGQGLPGGGHVDANKIFLTVWDGGGTDTYDLSNYTTNMHLDLTPGGWSRVSDAQTAVRHIKQQVVGVQPFEVHQASGNIYNAYMFKGDQRSLIENANGGAGHDWVEGNIGANLLRGNGGDDVLNGREGNDQLFGGTGNDLLFGDKREGGPTYNGPGYLQLGFGATNSSFQTAFDLTPYAGRQFNQDVRDSDSNPRVSVDVTGNGNGQDYFRIFIPGPGLLVADIDYGMQRSFNAYMALFNSNGALLSSSDESGVDSGSSFDLLADPNDPTSERGSEDPHIVYSVSVPGWYTLSVDDHIGRGVYVNGSYRLSITLPNYDENPGSEGNDRLDGGIGGDRLFGQGGDDVLIGGPGADTLQGGAGTDTGDYSGSPAGVTVNLLNGTGQGGDAQGDLLFEVENLTGSAHADRLTGDAGRNVLIGNGGDDTLLAGPGNDGALGGAGNDRLYGEEGDDELVGGTGDDMLYGYFGDDVLEGGLGKDRLAGGDGADRFVFRSVAETPFSAGRDVIVGWGTGDVVDLSPMDADATLVGNQGFTWLGMTAVTSAVAAAELRAFQVNGNTFLLGGADASGRGDFQIELTGLHTLRTSDFLGIERVKLSGTDSADTMIGLMGDDVLDGGFGNDRLYGVEGNDLLIGGAGDDMLYGHFGDDVLEGGLGKDRLAGGDGADRFVYRAATETPFSADRDLVVGWHGGDIVDLSAMDADLTRPGNQGFTFLGMTGVTSAAGAGELRAFHHNGNTYLLGGVDADGRGDFQIEITGLHTLTTGSLDGLQNAILTGANAADTIIGTSGNDILSGHAGNDRLYGIEGDDVLIGGAGDDALYGYLGDDVLEGGQGKDRVAGGEGADRFVYRAATETPFSADRDLIIGWDSGDVIDLSAMDADLTRPGNQGFTFLGMTAVSSAANAGELRAFHHNGNIYLLGGVDADGRGDFQIEIAGLQSLGVDQIWLG